MTISLWHLRTLARHHGPVPDQAIEHRSTDHPAVITGAQLSPISAKPSTATAAQTSNPHSRPAAHRLPAGSFFGGFRTPALGSAARFNDRPVSETLHEAGLSPSSMDIWKADIRDRLLREPSRNGDPGVQTTRKPGECRIKSTTRPSAKKPVIAKAAIREENGRSARNRFVVRGSVGPAAGP